MLNNIKVNWNIVKKIYPEAFIEGTLESEIRKDLNLIWSVYEVDGEEVEMFHVYGW